MQDVRGIYPGTALNDAQAVGVIKVLVESGKSVKAAAAAAASGNPAAVRSFLTVLYRHGQIDPARLGVMAEAGRTLSVLNEPVSGMNRFLKQFEQLLQSGTSGITPQRLAQMVDDFQTPEQLAVFAKQVTKPGKIDMVLEAWVNGLLSGPQTHVVNSLSNALTTLWAIPERAIAARLGDGGVAKGEALQMLYGVVGSIQDALQLAGKAFKTGESASGLSKVEGRRKVISGANLDLTGGAGRAVDILGEAFRLPSRLLLTTDELFRVINYRAELRAHAFREGMATAAAEGLQGSARDRRAAEVMEGVLRDPAASIKLAAENFASYQTFTKNLGQTGENFAEALNSHPALRVAVPFFKTPVNLAKYGLERTPLALVADFPILREIMPEMAANLRAGGARRELALAKASLGSAVMATVGTMAAVGMVTGGGPKDPHIRREWLKTHQPYSWSIGGKWVAYNRVDAPVGMIMGMAADAADAMVNMPQGERDDVAQVLAIAIGRNLTSKTYLKGISETLNAVSDPERYGKNPLRNLGASMIPFSSLVATVERVTDPTLRETQTFLDHVYSRIPGLSSTCHRSVICGARLSFPGPRAGGRWTR